MKVLIISQYFWPENFKINDITSDLCKKGHEITVLTCDPNYPNKSLFVNYYSEKNKYKLFHKAKIIRVPIISRGNSRIQLFLNYISFFISASTIGIFKLKKNKYDKIFVFQTSPATVIIPALIISKTKKIPIIMWVLDLWPETLVSMNVISNKIIIKFFEYLMQQAYRRCNLILCQSKKITKHINKGSKKKNAKYFPSWAEEVFYRSVHKKIDKFPLDKNKFNIFFTGNVGDAQDFDTVLDAFAILQAENINTYLNIVGEGSKILWLKNTIKIKKINNIKIHGKYDLEYMPYIYSLSDALLVSLKDTNLFSYTIPAKIQTYLLSKKPIIGMIAGESANIIKEAKCGLFSMPGNKHDLVNNIKKIVSLSHNERDKLGKNGLVYSNKNFLRSRLLNELSDILET